MAYHNGAIFTGLMLVWGISAVMAQLRPIYFSRDCLDREQNVTVLHGETGHQQLRTYDGGMTGTFQCSCFNRLLSCNAVDIPCWSYDQSRVRQQTRGVFAFCSLTKRPYYQGVSVCPSAIEKYDCLCNGGRAGIANCRFVPDGCLDEMFGHYTAVGNPFIQIDGTNQNYVCKCDRSEDGSADFIGTECRQPTSSERNRLLFGDLPELVFKDEYQDDTIVKTNTSTTPGTPAKTTSATTRIHHRQPNPNPRTTTTTTKGPTTTPRTTNIERGPRKQYCKLKQAGVRFPEGSTYVYQKSQKKTAAKITYNCRCFRRNNKMVASCVKQQANRRTSIRGRSLPLKNSSS